MAITLTQLQKMVPENANISTWIDELNRLLPTYEINTTQRIAAFMAECCVESNNFSVLKENLNYTTSGLVATWPTRFNANNAPWYAHNPEKIANLVYGGRLGNGIMESGEGFMYIGRGLIQMTGKKEYKDFAIAIKMQLADVPAYLETKYGALHSACWYWQTNNLNTYCDAGDIDKVSEIINGGTHALQARHDKYLKNLQILGT